MAYNTVGHPSLPDTNHDLQYWYGHPSLPGTNTKLGPVYLILTVMAYNTVGHPSLPGTNRDLQYCRPSQFTWY